MASAQTVIFLLILVIIKCTCFVDVAETWNTRGMELFTAKEIPSASQAFAEATKLSPNNSIYWYNYGMMQFIQKRYDRANVAFQKVLSLQTESNAAMHVHRGISFVCALEC